MRIAYITNDGKEFESKEQAEKYELKKIYQTFFKENELLDSNLNRITSENKLYDVAYCSFKDRDAINLFNLMLSVTGEKGIRYVENNLKYLYDTDTNDYIPFAFKVAKLKEQQKKINLILKVLEKLA